MFRGIDVAEAAAEHRNGAPTDAQRRAMRRSVDSARAPADNEQSPPRKISHQSSREIETIGGGRSTAHDRQGPRILIAQGAEQVERWRRIGDEPQERRVIIISERHHAHAQSLHGAALFIRSGLAHGSMDRASTGTESRDVTNRRLELSHRSRRNRMP